MEFNVGDWVREDFGDMNVTQVKEKFIADDGSVYINNFNSELFSAWQPKEGEWCWVGKNLSKIVAHDRDGYATCLNSNGTYTTYMKLEYIYKIAEPFIGELPSFLKDKQCGL